jgi:hypothetical protein
MSINSVFLVSLGLTVLLYLLRGFGLITFLPGGILLILISITFVSGIFSGIRWTQRY